MITLTSPVTKSEIAFRFSFDTLWASSSKHYFWTLTPIRKMGDKEFAAAINAFKTRWFHWGTVKGFKALRIFEPFQSGFLHCHFVCNQRIPISQLRRLAIGTGIGRIHVRKARREDSSYMINYVTKANRDLPIGVRGWGKWGQWEHSRVHNITTHGEGPDLFRACYQREKLIITEVEDGSGFLKLKVRNKPRGQAWVDARVRFFKERLGKLGGYTNGPF